MARTRKRPAETIAVPEPVAVPEPEPESEESDLEPKSEPESEESDLEPEPIVQTYQLSTSTHTQPQLGALVAVLGNEDIVEIDNFQVSSLEENVTLPRVECVFSRTTGLLHLVINANIHIEIPTNALPNPN